MDTDTHGADTNEEFIGPYASNGNRRQLDRLLALCGSNDERLHGRRQLAAEHMLSFGRVLVTTACSTVSGSSDDELGHG